MHKDLSISIFWLRPIQLLHKRVCQLRDETVYGRVSTDSTQECCYDPVPAPAEHGVDVSMKLLTCFITRNPLWCPGKAEDN